MSSLRIDLSPPEAVERFRDVAQALLEWEKGELSAELRQRLAGKARDLGVHPLDRDAVLAEMAALPAIQALRRLSGAGAAETLLADRYRDNGDGTVTDVRTGLQWMRFSLGQEWKGGTCVGEAKKYTWQAALDAAKALNRQGGYAGHQDWRVPMMEELQTLIYCSSGQPKPWNDTGRSCEGDYERPTIYQTAFPNTPDWWYWSSSSCSGYPASARYVPFDGGHVLAFLKGNGLHARLARGDEWYRRTVAQEDRNAENAIKIKKPQETLDDPITQPWPPKGI